MAQSSKVKFTEPRVEAFSCEPNKQQSLFWDSDTKGLAVRVTMAGAKAYIFESRMDGRTIRVTIGSPDSWPLKKAQFEARRIHTLVDQGIDPPRESRQSDETGKPAPASTARAYDSWRCVACLY